MLSLMTVETSALGRPIEIDHYTVYQELPASSVTISSLLRVAVVGIAVAVSIIRITPGRIVRVLPGLRISRQTQGQNSTAKEEHTEQAFHFENLLHWERPTALRIGRFSDDRFSHQWRHPSRADPCAGPSAAS